MVTVIQQGSNRKMIDRVLVILFKQKKNRGIDTQKYCGVLELKEDALEIQKRLRSEWE